MLDYAQATSMGPGVLDDAQATSTWPGKPLPPAMVWAMSLGLVVLGAVVLWFRFNVPPGHVGKVFPTDLVFYYYPMMEYASERLAAGDLPLWNPYPCCGVPFLATAQVAVFYPGTWLSLLMSTGTAVKVLMFGEVLLAGLFAALFFRTLGVSEYAAAIGGVLFIFACVLGQTFWPPEVSTILWMPLLFLAVEKFTRQGRWRWWAVFTAATTLQILAGFPQFLVYTFYLLGPYAILRLVQGYLHSARKPQDRNRQLRRGVALAAGCLLALGLAGPQVLPTRELVQQSARAEGLTEQEIQYLERTGWKPPDMQQILRNAFDPRPKLIAFDFLNGTGYLGMVTLFLIGLGIVAHWRKALTWFLVIAAVAWLLLSFGDHLWSGALYKLYRLLPTGGMFRTPGRFRLLTYFCLIGLAVLGADQFRTGLAALRADARLRLAAVVAGLIVLAGAVRLAPLGGLVLAGISAGLLAGAFFFWRSAAWMPVAWQVLLVVLILADLTHATARYGTLRDIPVRWGQRLHIRGAALVGPRAVQRIAQDAGYERVCPLNLRPVKPIRPLPRLYTVCDYEALLPARWTHASRAMGGHWLRTMYGVSRKRFETFYDLASVRYFIVPRGKPDLNRPERQAEHWRRYGFHTWAPRPASPEEIRAAEYRNRDGLPRAYLVGRFEICQPQEALRRIARGDFDCHTTVLLEQDPGMPSDAAAGVYKPAAIVSYTPERVVIRTSAQRERLLVLTDTYYPGWQALVDDKPTPILRANYLFRAVRVPPGDHEVVFVYQPASFRAGLAMAGGSFVAFALVSAGWWYRQRRSDRATGAGSSPRRHADRRRTR